MGWGMLTPLFLGGAALLVIPWIVHQVRRPERHAVRFSSLMFVPDVRKDVLERRKIQHPWLMLLRMLLLLLLALAFTRPFREVQARTDPAATLQARHVILLDTSYSMGTQGWFEDAKARAFQVLDEIGRSDPVAVVTFAAAPRVVAPLTNAADSEAGSPARARQAIQSARRTWEPTAYLPALQTAEKLLIPTGLPEDVEGMRLIVHLITDFQHAGMPRTAASWKLSPRIELNPIEVGRADAPNLAVTDLAVEEAAAQQLRIRGKVKNWNMAANQPIPVKLTLGGRALETKSLAVKAGNASQVIFMLPWSGRESIEGQLTLGNDALTADNQFYFTWNPRRKHPVLLVSDEPTSRSGSAARFVRLALTPETDLPWTLREVSQAALGDQLTNAAGAPEIVFACGLNGLRPETAAALLDYARQGGQVLLALGANMPAEMLNQSLLAGSGLNCAGPLRASADESIFETLAWVDLDHRIFMPFRGSPYNDFTAVHFFNNQRLEVGNAAAEAAPRVLARFEDDSPAMIEFAPGKGRIVLWAFGLDPQWTNLPKKAMFVPLLHETLTYLTRTTRTSIAHTVGENATPPEFDEARGRLQAQVPGDAGWRDLDGTQAAPAIALDQPGFLRWQTAAPPERRQAEAVNVDPREGDPLRVTLDEFKLRLCSATASETARGRVGVVLPGSGDKALVKREFGLPVIAALLAFLILESLYATRLAATADGAKEEAT